MVAQPITIRPGLNVEATPLLNEAGFSSCQLVRFFGGLCQKLGGWSKFSPTQLVGVCRGMFANQDLDGNQYLALGTNEVLDLYENGVIYDITPITATADISDPFTTVSTSKNITVHDTVNTPAAGDVINVVTETAIGGLLLQGLYEIQSITDSTHYVIASPAAATGSVAGGGTTSLFTTTDTSATVQVTLTGHGLAVGDPYTVNVSTTVATIVLLGTYAVASVIDANNFTIVAASAANASTTGSENGGNVRIAYLLPAGLADATPSAGYGIGEYGEGFYGYGTSTGAITLPRQWHFGAWGEDLAASPTDGGIYIWDASAAPLDNPAAIISEAPTMNTAIFIAMPQQQIVAIGAEVGGVQDPLLVRWCDVADYTDWTATVTNQAGSFRIPSGSNIVGGLQGPQQGLIWTDSSLWAMQYVQPPFVYGFNEIGLGCGLIGSRAMGVLGSYVYWLNHDSFFIYNGTGVVRLPCPVWDKIFQNLNIDQVEKITCAPNSSFNEIAWYFPSLSGDGEVDMYIKYNASDNVWDYGTLGRTAWLDLSIFTQPMGVDLDGYVQQHEISNDADGSPMVSWAQTGLLKLDGGDLFIFVERMIPDFILSSGATMTITVYTYNYQNDAPVFSNSYTVTSATEYIIVRARGRFASIKVESNDLGSFWRLGLPIYWGSPAGRR